MMFMLPQSVLEGLVVKTPFVFSETISKTLGAEMWLKFENLQFTASFKERGALNKLLCLSEQEKATWCYCSFGRQSRTRCSLPCSADRCDCDYCNAEIYAKR